MKKIILLTFAAFAFHFCMAQAPADAPTGATGRCNDGTYYFGSTKQGACRGHKGVKDWYAAAPSPKPTPAPATTATPAPSVKPVQPTTSAGAGQVWLNTSSNVYHCPGTRYYGKTKAGAYMTEAEAKSKGAHPDHGKPCS